MKGQWEYVNPAIATEYLEKSAGNRKERPDKISEMAEDMTAGRWFQNPHGIQFNTAGQLMDGHHRLKAVIHAGVTVRMMVFRDVPPEVGKVIDHGTPRSLADDGAMNGRPGLTADVQGALHAMIGRGCRRASNQLSNSVRLEIYDRYADALSFAVRVIPNKRDIYHKAVVRGVVARAFLYEEDKQRLEAFGAQMVDVECPPENTAAAALRSYLARSGGQLIDHHNVTDRCIHLFMQRTPHKLAKTSSKFHYPFVDKHLGISVFES